ncbi:MAG: phosphatase PAP2 family protein [Prevotella sp.]|nr:phosphatase PAP2 family protein [Prevotellaceae bacterium]MDY4628132.1 phosphatase PAP2 family protein [Prevotella sp.]MDY5344335.1 phosphatase PAP2 family protein [Prevotella sp.]
MKTALTVLLLLAASMTAMAHNTAYANDNENEREWKLESVEIEPRLTVTEKESLSFGLNDNLNVNPEINRMATSNSTNVKPYTFFQDQTYVGIPLFLAGVIAKSEKRSFRQNTADLRNSRTRLLTNFHSEIDNYTQFAPAVLALGLNVAGVEGRSNLGRFAVSSALAYGIMAGIVNPIKYGAKEMRPDGSTRNSFPSGHTATAFVSATILHKEYGLTRSPWYSIAGYGVATATGVMRVLNNRHWVSDVLSGAGIGIFSTELAYGISDIIFKGHGLKRGFLIDKSNAVENPSFFSISMGMGLGTRNMTFSGEELGVFDEEFNTKDVNLKFGTATVVGAEGAYFFNKYIGVGGRLRIKSNPIKGWSQLASDEKSSLLETIKGLKDVELQEWVEGFDIMVESDHITEFAGDLGLYFNFPLSSRFAIGTKALVGRSVIQDLEIRAHAWGKALDFSKIDDVKNAWGNDYDCDWDYMTVSGNNTMKVGTGVSLTYAYKSNFSFKVFLDYDYTKKNYTMEYSPNEFLKKAIVGDENNELYDSKSSTISKKMNSFVLGGAFCVSF